MKYQGAVPVDFLSRRRVSMAASAWSPRMGSDSSVPRCAGCGPSITSPLTTTTSTSRTRWRRSSQHPHKCSWPGFRETVALSERTKPGGSRPKMEPTWISETTSTLYRRIRYALRLVFVAAGIFALGLACLLSSRDFYLALAGGHSFRRSQVFQCSLQMRAAEAGDFNFVYRLANVLNQHFCFSSGIRTVAPPAC